MSPAFFSPVLVDGVSPSPVEVGKKYELEVTAISNQGDGIARIQGFVVFVKREKLGNKLRLKSIG